MPKRLLPERDPMRPEVSLALLLSSRIQHVMRTAPGHWAVNRRVTDRHRGFDTAASGLLHQHDGRAFNQPRRVA
jgi:hypothetical protein